MAIHYHACLNVLEPPQLWKRLFTSSTLISSHRPDMNGSIIFGVANNLRVLSCLCGRCRPSIAHSKVWIVRHFVKQTGDIYSLGNSHTTHWCGPCRVYRSNLYTMWRINEPLNISPCPVVTSIPISLYQRHLQLSEPAGTERVHWSWPLSSNAASHCGLLFSVCARVGSGNETIYWDA